MLLMSVYCSRDWLSLPYNALDISNPLLKGVLQFCAMKAAIKHKVVLETLYYYSAFQNLRASNSLYLLTPWSQQFKGIRNVISVFLLTS